MTLFFQSPSIGLALLALPQILRARRVLFYRPYWLSKDWANPRRKERAGRLIRWINPRADVADHDPEEAFPLAYENNLASDRTLEDFFPHVAGSASFNILHGLIQDPHLDRYYKIRLLPWVLYETQFYRTARHWADSGEEVCIVPGSYDRYAFCSGFFTEAQLIRRVPRWVRAGLRVKEIFSRCLNGLLGINLFLLLSSPLFFLLKTGCRSGIRARNIPLRADVVVPLIWGFNEDGACRGLQVGMDDSYILDRELDASRVAFYFSDWPFTREERRLQEERMAQRRIRHFDPERFPLTFRFLRETAGRYRQLLKGILRRPGLWAEDRRITWVSASLLYNLLKAWLFIEGVEYKVFLERRDYSAAHVVRTILSEQAGRLTVGDHHAAPDGPAGFPVIRYTHIHRHCVWGEAFLRAYGAHWDHMDNVLTGYWRTDFVKAAQEKGRLQALEERFRRLTGGRRPLIVLLFPTLDGHNILPHIREEIEGLRLLRDQPGEFTAVCRFRSVELAARYRAIGLEEVIRQDPRVVIDLSDFSTFEWIALSDAVVVNSISSGMIEAAAAGKPAFAFDHRRLAERIFSPYGADLILRNRQDLVRLFEQARSGFQGLDCRWEELARDFSRYSDGGCIRRYRQVILRAVEEVETQASSSRRRGSDPRIRGDDNGFVRPSLEPVAAS